MLTLKRLQNLIFPLFQEQNRLSGRGRKNVKCEMILRRLKYLILLGFFVLIFAFSWITIKRWRLPYENGRYFDEATATIIKDQSVLVYFLITFFLIILTIILINNIIKTKRKKCLR